MKRMANNEVKDQGTPSVEEMTFSDGETPVLVECDKHATYYHSAWHEEIEIKLVLSGTIRMMIGGALYEARSGDLLLINPYEIHSTIPGDADGTYHLIMLRTGSLLNFHADGDEVTGIVSGATRFCRLIRKKEIRDLCARLARECREEKKHYRLALRGLVLELIALLLRDGDVFGIRQRLDFLAGERHFDRQTARSEPGMVFRFRHNPIPHVIHALLSFGDRGRPFARRGRRGILAKLELELPVGDADVFAVDEFLFLSVIIEALFGRGQSRIVADIAFPQS